VVLHSKVADYVQNNRRRELADLERAYRIVVEIAGDPGVELSTERYEWFDVPAWEVPSVPDRHTGDEDDDRSPAESTALTDRGAVVESPPGDAVQPRTAARPRPAQEQRDEAGGGKRGRRKRRRRGGRNRDGSAQEPSTREQLDSPAASIGSVVDEIEDGVSGNVAPENDFPPADRVMSREALVTMTAEGMAKEAEDASPSSRRKRRRRRRSRGEGPSDQTAVQVKTAPPVLPSGAASPEVRHDEAWEAFVVPAVPPRAVEHTAEAATPAPAEVPVPQATEKADQDAPAPRKEPPVKKTPKRSVPKQPATKKETPAKAAPKKAVAKKKAAGKKAPSEPAGA
jgi:ribonuclease E